MHRSLRVAHQQELVRSMLVKTNDVHLVIYLRYSITLHVSHHHTSYYLR
jgi:hypothetical protein